MIDRGKCLGPGYVPGFGRVTVYASILRTDRLIVLTKRDEWRTVPRSRVTFTKKG